MGGSFSYFRRDWIARQLTPLHGFLGGERVNGDNWERSRPGCIAP